MTLGDVGFGVELGIDPAVTTKDRTAHAKLAHVRLHRRGHVLEILLGDRAIHRPAMGLRDGDVDHVAGTRDGQEGELRIGRAGAVAPQIPTFVADERRDLILVENVRAAVLVAVGVVNGTTEAADTIDFLVRRRLPKALLVVHARDQARHSGGRMFERVGVGLHGPAGHGRIDDEDAARAVVVAIGERSGVGGRGTIGDDVRLEAIGQLLQLADDRVRRSADLDRDSRAGAVAVDGRGERRDDAEAERVELKAGDLAAGDDRLCGRQRCTGTAAVKATVAWV